MTVTGLPWHVMLPCIIVAVVICLFGIKKLGGPWRGPFKDRASQYEAVPLLSPAEMRLYYYLTQIYGASVIVCPKVRLADLVRPVNVSDRSAFQSAFNRVSRKHVDFVFLRVEDLGIFGVVELDDRSHEVPSRSKRDAFVDDVLSQAGLAVCRIKARSSYSLDLLSVQVNEAFGGPGEIEPE